jgi:hypothetical protein
MKTLSFSLQDKQSVEEASGEGPNVEAESWQKECDSLRKVTEGVQVIKGVDWLEKEDCVLGRDYEFLVLGHLGSAIESFFLRSYPYIVSLHVRHLTL